MPFSSQKSPNEVPEFRNNRETEPNTQPPVLKRADLAEDVAANREADEVEDESVTVEKMAQAIHKLKATKITGVENLQKMFDWFSEGTQEKLLRADDRTFLGRFVEKWNPALDPREYNLPKKAMTSLFSFFATYGLITPKNPALLEKMRSAPGLGILDCPEWTTEVALAMVGLPEASVLVYIGRGIKGKKDDFAAKVRKRVEELSKSK